MKAVGTRTVTLVLTPKNRKAYVTGGVVVIKDKRLGKIERHLTERELRKVGGDIFTAALLST